MAETRDGVRSRWCSYFAVKLMLVTYAFLCWFIGSLCAAILVELVVGFIILLGKEQTKAFFSDHVRGGIRNYYDDLDFKNIMDFVQEEFQCCGADSYTDWESNPYHLCSAPGKAACGVPYSCCVTEKNPGALLNSHCGYGILHKERLELTEVIHVRGCTHALFLWIGDRLPLAIFVSVLILLSQVFGIATSYLLSKNITQTIEERRQNRTETDGPMLMEPAEDSSRMRRWLYMYLPHEQRTVTLMSAQT
ncbi:tetraspanin-15-like isoform X3 [Lampetra fluviatilis]